MAFKQNNPLSRKTSPINKDWIKGAIKRPGAFRKKAEEAGMSTKAFAEKVTSNKEDYSARTGRQAELAETLMGMSRHESGHVNPESGDFDYEDPNYRETKEYKKFKRKQKRKNKKDRSKDVDDKGRKRGEAGFQQDPQEARYEGVSRKSSGKNPYTNSPVGDLSGDKVYGPATAVIHVGKKIYKKGEELIKGAAKAGRSLGKAIKEAKNVTGTGEKPKVGISRKSSPLNDSYIKQEEKMIKRNQKRGNEYQKASAGSKTQRIQNATGAAKAQNAVNKSKETINMLKDIDKK